MPTLTSVTWSWPDRVLLERAVVVEIVMVVIVIGDALVLVHEIRAIDMVGQAVPASLVCCAVVTVAGVVVIVFILGSSHQNALLARYIPSAPEPARGKPPPRDLWPRAQQQTNGGWKREVNRTCAKHAQSGRGAAEFHGAAGARAVSQLPENALGSRPGLKKMDEPVSDTAKSTSKDTSTQMAAEAYLSRLGERGIEYVFANAGTDFDRRGAGRSSA